MNLIESSRARKNLNEFRFFGVFRVLGRDLIFPEFGLKLGDDLLEYAHQLPCDGLGNVWERFILILTGFVDFCARPSLFVRSCSFCSCVRAPDGRIGVGFVGHRCSQAQRLAVPRRSLCGCFERPPPCPCSRVRQSADRWLLCVRRSPVFRPRANQHNSVLALGELVRCSPSRSPALSASAPCVLAPSCARSWAPGRAWPSWFLCLRSFNSRLESSPSVVVRKFLTGGGGGRRAPTRTLVETEKLS